jgi:hypothetical protein
MAGGWARDGAVNEQIDASIEDELTRMKLKARRPATLSRSHCANARNRSRRRAVRRFPVCSSASIARRTETQLPFGAAASTGAVPRTAS